MGEAARKKKAEQAVLAALGGIDLGVFASAVRKTCEAITHATGADCVLYAVIGAGALSRMGVGANAVAGGAAWRVGLGDGDALTHYPSAPPDTWVAPEGTGQPTGMFHAWIEVGPLLLDLTTWAIPQKAAVLDQADGGTTSVQWCPEYLCAPRTACVPVMDAVQGYRVGAFGYERIAEVEALVLSDPNGDPSIQTAISVAVQTYSLLIKGSEVEVVGV